MEVMSEILPEDWFVLEEVKQEGRPYVVHRAPILAYSVTSRVTYERALGLYQRMKRLGEIGAVCRLFYLLPVTRTNLIESIFGRGTGLGYRAFRCRLCGDFGSYWRRSRGGD